MKQTKAELETLHAQTQAAISEVWAKIDAGAKGKAKRELFAELSRLEWQRNSLDFLLGCRD